MTLLIINSINLVVTLVIFILLVTGDTEVNKLRNTVEVKKLKLNERAIDMQMSNTEAYLQSLTIGQPEVKEEAPEEKEPSVIGFRQ